MRFFCVLACFLLILCNFARFYNVMKDYTEIRERGFGLVDIGKNTDARGSLCFAEWDNLPFEPKRVFWIYDVQEGKSRGMHAHRECEEVVFAVCGAFDMFVDNGKEQQTLRMDNPQRGIYIGKGVWCELKNFLPGTVCVVVASTRYLHHGYINDYEEYRILKA